MIMGMGRIERLVPRRHCEPKGRGNLLEIYLLTLILTDKNIN